MKHSYLSLENLIGHIIAIKNTGTAVIVRVPQDDFTFAKKVLEMGVDGSIFPMVKTAEQAKKLIDYTLYPPYGNRGFGPMNAVDFGFDDALKYWWDKGGLICSLPVPISVCFSRRHLITVKIWKSPVTRQPKNKGIEKQPLVQGVVLM